MATSTLARTDLNTIARLSHQLDQITAALAALASGSTVVGLFISDGALQQLAVDVPVPTAAVQTLLTNRQAAIQNLLSTTYGVT